MTGINYFKILTLCPILKSPVMLLSARLIPTSATLRYAQSHKHHLGDSLRAKKITVVMHGIYVGTEL